ncbi:MAG: rhomboid family intramembrane serine protease [Ferruginibacter sp.]
MAYRTGNSIQRQSPVVFNLIIINVLVFIVQFLFDEGDKSLITSKLALHNYHSEFFEPYQLVTAMFAHGGVAHILFNMFALFTFGTWLERVWGSKRFLIFYLICGLVSNIVEMVFIKDVLEFDPALGGNVLFVGSALGASGAIMGLFAAFAYLFPNTELIMMFIPVPIKAKYMVAIMVAIDLFGQFGPIKTGIAHYAHLSGLLMGFILVLLWNRTNKKTFY